MNLLFAGLSGQIQPSTSQPARSLVVLGETALLGTLTGFLAIEKTGPNCSRLWALHEEDGVKYTYARVCVDAPDSCRPLDNLEFWVNPRARLTAAVHGSDWLATTPAMRQPENLQKNALRAVKLNALMISAPILKVLEDGFGSTVPLPAFMSSRDFLRARSHSRQDQPEHLLSARF